MEKHRSPHLLFVIIQTDGTRQLLDSSKQSSCLSKSNGKSRRPPGAEKPRASRIRTMPWPERPRKVCDPPSRTRDSPRRFPVGPSEVAPGAGGTSTEVPFRGPRLFLATEHAIRGEQRRPGIRLCESHTVNVAQDPTTNPRVQGKFSRLLNLGHPARTHGAGRPQRPDLLSSHEHSCAPGIS